MVTDRLKVGLEDFGVSCQLASYNLVRASQRPKVSLLHLQREFEVLQTVLDESLATHLAGMVRCAEHGVDGPAARGPKLAGRLLRNTFELGVI